MNPSNAQPSTSSEPKVLADGASRKQKQLESSKGGAMVHSIENTPEEMRIRCDALRGLLYAECGFELNEISAVEAAALAEFRMKRTGRREVSSTKRS